MNPSMQVDYAETARAAHRLTDLQAEVATRAAPGVPDTGGPPADAALAAVERAALGVALRLGRVAWALGRVERSTREVDERYAARWAALGDLP